MCGIYVTNKKQEPKAELTHRGPDHFYKTTSQNGTHFSFYRLEITGMKNGGQPFCDGNGIYVIVNGEIYNSFELMTRYNFQHKTLSDCEIILHLYKRFGIYKTLDLLDGEFAFVILDENTEQLFFARDICGVKPLYYSFDDEDQTFEISSEMKSIHGEGIQQAKPRILYTYYTSFGNLNEETYYSFEEQLEIGEKIKNITHDQIYAALEDAVKKRIRQGEREMGFLLSGGFDSSLLLSIALSLDILPKKTKVFTIGFSEDAPDVKSAKVMVAFLQEKYGIDCVEHHVYIPKIEEGINCLKDVIYHLETFDTTTIRASTPMYLISKYIKERTNVRIVISAELADELFGGYLYFLYCRNDYEYVPEIIKLLNEVYLFDVLRSDRTTAAWGLEVRPPMTDKKFMNTVLRSGMLNNQSKISKPLIREIVKNMGLLPQSILWGKKDAFSDAVGLEWKDEIFKYANSLDFYSFADIQEGHLFPTNNEQRLYQTYFIQLFGSENMHLTEKLWLPNKRWIDVGDEPSARVLPVFNP